MSRHFAIVLHPIEMTQKFLNLFLRFFVLAAVFLAESRSSAFNITRYTTGDVFQNANSSKTCFDSGAACLLKVEDSPFCGKNCCDCVCRSDTPTYLLRNGSCSSEDHLMSILKAQSQIQGKYILFPWQTSEILTWSKCNVENAIFGIVRRHSNTIIMCFLWRQILEKRIGK